MFQIKHTTCLYSIAENVHKINVCCSPEILRQCFIKTNATFHFCKKYVTLFMVTGMELICSCGLYISIVELPYEWTWRVIWMDDNVNHHWLWKLCDLWWCLLPRCTILSLDADNLHVNKCILFLYIYILCAFFRKSIPYKWFQKHELCYIYSCYFPNQSAKTFTLLHHYHWWDRTH